MCAGGHHVAAFAGVHFAHRDAGGAPPVARDPLSIIAAAQAAIRACVPREGRSPRARAAFDVDVELGGRQKAVRSSANSPRRAWQPPCARPEGCRRRPTPAAAMAFAPRTPSSAGWKMNFASAELILVAHRPARRRAQERGMGIVPAGVHEAGVFGCEPAGRRRVVRRLALTHEHAVDVGAEGRRGRDGRCRAPPLRR